MPKAPEPEPESVDPVEIEISVAGHTVIVKAARSMEDVAAQAVQLFERTQRSAMRIPIGFAVTGGQFELTEQPDYSSVTLLPEEE